MKRGACSSVARQPEKRTNRFLTPSYLSIIGVPTICFLTSSLNFIDQKLGVGKLMLCNALS